MMKANRVGVLCVLLLAVGAVTVRGQAYPARIKLTCIQTNATGLLKTQITEKDIVARCASATALDPSRLKLFFVFGDLAVVDMVTTNVECRFATIEGEVPTNVAVVFFSGTDSNNVKGATFSPFNSPGEGMLPTDFSGTLCTTVSESMSTNGGLGTIVLKGTIQGGSVTNNAVYTGTLTVGGKPFGLPPG